MIFTHCECAGWRGRARARCPLGRAGAAVERRVDRKTVGGDRRGRTADGRTVRRGRVTDGRRAGVRGKTAYGRG
eukprot:283607-Pyramimonas_sp.AAC.1